LSFRTLLLAGIVHFGALSNMADDREACAAGSLKRARVAIKSESLEGDVGSRKFGDFSPL